MIKLPADYIVYGEPGIYKSLFGDKYYIVIHSKIPYQEFIPSQWITGFPDSIQDDVPFYLHSDGEWRLSTKLYSGEFTGYYETKEAAELALKSAIGDNND